MQKKSIGSSVHIESDLLHQSIGFFVYNHLNFSGMYNSSELELHWEEPSPIAIAPEFRLTEYALMDSWTNKTVVRADLNNLRHGSFSM